VSDTCTNCNTVLSPTSSSCPSCGTPKRSQSSGGTSGGAFCGSCGTALASKFSPCPKCGHVKTTFAPPPQSGGFCGGCGGPLPSKFSPCPKCGHVKTTFAPPPQYSNPGVNPQGGYPQGGYPQGGLYKSSGTTNLLSILFSILLVTSGVGHLYLGQIGKGIGLMIGGWILIIVGASTMFFGIGFLFLIGWFVLWIYSMVNANSECSKYNQFVSQNGRPPW
jgi:RNA polymerase subunit RPABC4/transcription elongation factor Spt4